MFGFVNELSQITGLPFDEISGGCNINWRGRMVYISNFIKILSYSEEKILLKIKNNVLTIAGQNLVIAQLSPKEIVLKGDILSLALKNKITKETK